MSKGNKIFISGRVNGKHEEGIISGTPYPGTVIQTRLGVEPVDGVYTWEVYNADADGDRRQIAILLENELYGKIMTQAYVDGERCFFYTPQAGEHFNMLISDIAGTGTGTGTGDEGKQIGDLLIVEDGTGLLIATSGTPESEPFKLMETQLGPISANALLHCEYTGY